MEKGLKRVSVTKEGAACRNFIRWVYAVLAGNGIINANVDFVFTFAELNSQKLQNIQAVVNSFTEMQKFSLFFHLYL